MWCEPQIASARLRFFQYVNASTTYFEKYTCRIWGRLIPKLAGTSEIWAVGQDYTHAEPHGKVLQGAQRESHSDGTWDTESEVMELRAALDGL